MPRAVSLLALVSLFATGTAHGQPSIGATTPQAVSPGGATSLRITGGGLNGSPKLWTSFNSTAELDANFEGNGTNAGDVRFVVNVPVTAAVGIHGIRVTTEQGVSPLRLFVVDDLPSVAGEPGHDSRETAQAVTIPCAVDGTVDSLKLKYFRFAAKAGQRLSFEVLARRMGSPLDPVIRLLDDAGRELAYSDDESGLTGDCRLTHVFAADGDYLVELRDIRYQGGGGHRFRLRMGDFPCLDVPVPMAVQRGAKVTLSFAGPNAESVEPVTLDVPSDPSVDWLNVSSRFKGGTASGFVRLAVTDGPQAIETEPNDELAKATRVGFGSGLNGRLDKPRDVDHFVFPAKKGARLRFSAVTRRQGSAADLYLRLLDAKGRQLAVADDTGANDGEINFTFPADGDYVLAVEDLHRRGGSRFAYRIDVGEPDVGFSLAATADRVNVPAGGVGLVTLNVARTSYKGAIELVAEGLPEGITASPATIGPNLALGVISLQAGESVPPGTTWAPRIVGRATIGGRAVTRTASITATVKAANGNVPYPPQTLTESLLAGSAPAAPFSLQLAVSEVVFGKSLSGKLKVVAKRREGYDGEIALAIEPAKGGVPPNIGPALKPIPAGANEVEIAFNANDKAALGRFATALRGTLKKDKQTVVQFAPAITLRLEKPFTLDVEPKSATIKPGETVALTVQAARNPALAGAIELGLENLPAGVTVAKTTLAADADSVQVMLTAAADAKPADVKNVVVAGTATVGKAKLTEKSGMIAVAVPKADN